VDVIAGGGINETDAVWSTDRSGIIYGPNGVAAGSTGHELRRASVAGVIREYRRAAGCDDDIIDSPAKKAWIVAVREKLIGKKLKANPYCLSGKGGEIECR
jgi:hypothetical protein